MTEESLPQLTKAPIPMQTHILRLEERIAKGKALREVATRKAQQEWKPPANRRDPVDLLIESSQGREEELLPIRYGRMMASPFSFYRGAAAIMAYDLSHTPSTGLTVLSDGDCHLMNFGGFATAERKVIFDLNDFDEASFAPWEWDVKRLTASFVVAGRSNGFAPVDCREAALTGRAELPPAYGGILRDADIASLERCLGFPRRCREHARQRNETLLHQKAGRHR